MAESASIKIFIIIIMLYLNLRHLYPGKIWADKVKEVQNEMKKVGATAHVVQELDSIACEYIRCDSIVTAEII